MLPLGRSVLVGGGGGSETVFLTFCNASIHGFLFLERGFGSSPLDSWFPKRYFHPWMVVKIDIYAVDMRAVTSYSDTLCHLSSDSSDFYHPFFPENPLKTQWDQRWVRLPNILVPLGLPGSSDGKASACSEGDLGSIPGLGRSPGEGNGNPLQYSCLENSMDGGAW